MDYACFLPFHRYPKKRNESEETVVMYMLINSYGPFFLL